MDSRAETTKRVQTTSVGTLDLTLSLDASGANHRTLTQVRSSAEKVAREVPIVIGSLLFAERQMRMINDPARLAAVDEMEAARRASREGRLVAEPPPAGRVAATYRIELLANGGFHATVEEKTIGVLSDAAGGMAAGALPAELLTALREPYRTFYLEMLEAAIGFWRERRPSPIESTWVWKVALRRLDQLMRAGVDGLGKPLICANCHALRPAGSPCLHCESAPGASPLGETAHPPTTASPPAVESLPPNRPSEPVAEAPADVAPSVTLSAPPPTIEPTPEPVRASSAATERPETASQAPDERPATGTILAAQEMPPAMTAVTEEPPKRPLAGLMRRGLSLVVDLVIGFALASFGSLGLTTVFMVVGVLGPADDPRQVFSALWLLFFGLYFVFGWTAGETYGMMICRIQVVREADQGRCGFFHALGRAIGYLLVVGLGVIVFVIGIWIDDNILVFIPGGTPADEAIRVIVGLVALYVMWLGSGQRILGEPARQTWGDRVGKTLVVSRQKAP